MCALQRCFSDTINTISSPVVNTDSKDSIECAHFRDVYVIVIGNRVRSLIRTPVGQYQVRTLKRCLCYSDRKYSSLFNTDSKRTVSSVRNSKISML